MGPGTATAGVNVYVRSAIRNALVNDPVSVVLSGSVPAERCSGKDPVPMKRLGGRFIGCGGVELVIVMEDM